MHSRYIAFSLILFTLWQVIGVGYTLTTHDIALGEMLTEQKIAKSIKLSTLTGARLTGIDPQPKYDSLIFVGDVLLARNVEFLMRTKGNNYPFIGVSLSEFGLTPALIGNFEAAIPIEHMPTPVGQITFSVPEQFVPYLSENGFTHVSLANNHTNDFGNKDLEHTRARLDDKLSTFGDPHTISVSDVTKLLIGDREVSVIGINALVPIYTKDLRTALASTESDSEYQIVYIHWGEEYALRHNLQQRVLAEQLVEYGADLIIGHHPHVVQGIENIDGTLVFYSLGNYIFDQYFSKDVQEGLVVSINFDDQLTVNLLPVTSRNTPSQPRMMSPENHEFFLEQLARKSDPELRTAIRSGQIKINLEIATSEKLAMMSPIDKYVQ